MHSTVIVGSCSNTENVVKGNWMAGTGTRQLYDTQRRIAEHAHRRGLIENDTIVFPAGLMDAFAAHPERETTVFDGSGYLSRVDACHYLTFEADDGEPSRLSMWASWSPRRWWASFETFGEILVTHLRAHS